MECPLGRRGHLAKRPLLEQRGVAPDHGKRGTELVRGDLHELAARPLQLGEGFGAAAFPPEGLPGIDADRGLGGDQL